MCGGGVLAKAIVFLAMEAFVYRALPTDCGCGCGPSKFIVCSILSCSLKIDKKKKKTEKKPAAVRSTGNTGADVHMV